MAQPPGHNLRETCLTRVHDDVPVHFQIITLPRQTLVWVGCGSPRLDSLSIATKVAQSAEPAATSLLGWNAESVEQALASKLAKSSGKSILLSLNIPKKMPGMERFVEQELRAIFAGRL